MTKRFGILTFTVERFNNGFMLPIPAALMWLPPIWPYNFKWIYVMMFSILPTGFVVFGEFGAVIHFWPQVTAECNVGSTIITGLRFVFIVSFIGFNVDKFIRMMDLFAAEIWISPNENKEAHEKSENGMLLSNCISGSMCGALVIYLLVPLINTQSREETLFPFLIIYPFDVKPTLIYFSIYVCCFFAGVMAVCGIVGHDTLMNYMLLHTCTRLQLLCKQIENIGEQTSETHEGDIRQTSGEIKATIQEHCRLISFVKCMEELFSPQILTHFIGTSMLICILGIQLFYDNVTIVEKMKIILYLITALGQLFVNCNSGEKLMQMSFKVAQAVYNSKWPDLSTTYRVSILMIMQRSQKPLHLTAGKFFDLSMMTFSSVLQSAMSYFALLKHMLDRSPKMQ